MKPKERLLIRLAIAIHEQLITGQSMRRDVELPTSTWQQCEVLLRQMHLAQQHGWQLAAGRLQRDLQEMLRRLHGELIGIDRMLMPIRNDLGCLSVRDIHADLLALHEEFDGVSFDRRGRTISVTIEPIELEGAFGALTIEFDLEKIDGQWQVTYQAQF